MLLCMHSRRANLTSPSQGEHPMRKRMFLSGSTGFIGLRVVDEAVSTGWEVRALVRSRESAGRLKERGAIAVLGDAETPQKWIDEVRSTDVLVDLLQPKIPK